MASKQELARGLVKDLYGGSLYEFGRGYYVTLELLAIAWGVDRLDPSKLLAPGSNLEFNRRSHDFVRRLLRDPERFLAGSGGVASVADHDVLEVLADLFRGLVVPVPFRRVPPDWGGYHLFPYVGELIHYDAVDRKGIPHIERYAYRGAGALVYELLRTDDDNARRARVRNGIRALVHDSGSSLGQIADLLANDDDEPVDATKDDTYKPHGPERDSRWVEILRAGVDGVLQSDDAPARKVDQLCHWVPFALTGHQVALAYKELGQEPPPVPVDVCVGGALRRQSQRTFDQNRRSIWEALLVRASVEEANHDGESGKYAQLREAGYATWNSGVERFYSSTLAVIGGVNSNFGVRHYTLSPGLLEAIVAATVTDEEGMPFTDFCTDVLWRQLGLVVDDRSAREAGLPAVVNDAAFNRNASGLEDLLQASGLMVSLSDSTRLVGASS